jgi:phospholipase/lecithinase/hemolysin
MGERWRAMAVAAALGLAAPAAAKPVDFLFVAGDSLSDPGNVFAITSAASALFPAFVQPIPPSPPYFEGRFSDGPVWVEELGDRLGLTAPEVRNVALGGAKTSGHTALDDVPVFARPLLSDAGIGGLRQQVDTYLAAGGPVSPDGLYVLWAGATNYLFDEPATTPAGLPRPVVDVDRSVRELAEAGATRFLVPNLPDLGRLPSTRGGAQAAALTTATTTHNTALAATLADTATALGLDIEVFDVARYFAEAQAGAFGFANVTRPCLRAPATCGEALFFDGIHPTAAAHDLLADFAFEAISTPLPAGVVLLTPALAVLAGLARLAGRNTRAA